MSSAVKSVRFGRQVGTVFWMIVAYIAAVAVLQVAQVAFYFVYPRANYYLFRSLSMGLNGAGVALCAWAAWSSQPIRDTALAALGFAWIFVAYYLGDAIRIGRIENVSSEWLEIPFWIVFWLASLLCVRWLAGVRLAELDDCQRGADGWRLRLSEALVFIALACVTLAVARIVYHKPWKVWPVQGYLETIHNLLLDVEYYAYLAVLCLGTIPLAMTVVFCRRWLVVGMICTLFVALLVGGYQKWRHPLEVQQPQVSILWMVELLSSAAHASLLLAVLRWRGYRLTTAPSWRS